MAGNRYTANRAKPLPRCGECGREFIPTGGRQKYCLGKCQRAVRAAVARRTIAAKKADIELQRLHRAVQVAWCQICGKSFAFRARKLFCEACREINTKAYREKWAQLHPNAGKEKARRYLEKNRAKVIEKKRQRRAENPERDRAYGASKRGRAAKAAYEKRRLSTDPSFVVGKRISHGMRLALHGMKAGRSWEQLVCYTLANLVTHLERQFLPGMTWENMGKWHIDHIVPKASFEYQSPDDAEFKACWALTNLRPLWSRENVSKGARRLLLI